MKNLTWQNPEQLFVAQVLINKVKSKCCGIKDLNNHNDAVVEITGYADAGTGTPSINERLSAKRAEAVKRILVGDCGIDVSRVRVSHKGDTVQPFAENDMNRVSICIISN